MLVELSVRNLGVIGDLSLLLGPGATALTGETGAGKTLVVEAIELLLGARSDPGLVRANTEEARVDGRFCVDEHEFVLTRVVPRRGRARAYVNGRPATASTLAELGGALVELHSQHAQHSLLGVDAQRRALDQFGAVDLSPLEAAIRRVHEIGTEMAALGGDERVRAREMDLLRFQQGELRAARLEDPEEDAALEEEEDLLGGVEAHRSAAEAAVAALGEDGGAVEAVGAAVHALVGRSPLAEIHGRLRAVQSELYEAAMDLRHASESMEADPQRLAAVRSRRQQLRQLCRKYGDNLAAVIKFGEQTGARLAELEGFDERASKLGAAMDRSEADLGRARDEVRSARLAAAPRFAAAIESRLRQLALPRAGVAVEVGGADGSAVSIRLSANPGSPLAPLARAASGGELARTMLAIRLALLEEGANESDPPAVHASREHEAIPLPASPATLVFDEVDAGVGGQAALAVGRALSAVASTRQVLLVTHLAQVAAYADAQVAVHKAESRGETTTTVETLDREHRVVELARMLSGQPDSATARRHAAELLAEARTPASHRRVTRRSPG